ncbi:MAG: CinA family protein [Chloroflexota bacterium]
MADERLADLARRLQQRCIEAGITVAVAESCTGGLVADAITDVSGSSAYFVGGVVSYSDEIKRELLGVQADVLAAHGAVSAQVARAMADGVLARLGADIAGSVTGIAGPDGGTTEKPVGLVYVGVAGRGPVDVRRHLWSGDRVGNKRDSAAAVLEALIERVGGDRS